MQVVTQIERGHKKIKKVAILKYYMYLFWITLLVPQLLIYIYYNVLRGMGWSNFQTPCTFIKLNSLEPSLMIMDQNSWWMISKTEKSLLKMLLFTKTKHVQHHVFSSILRMVQEQLFIIISKLMNNLFVNIFRELTFC